MQKLARIEPTSKLETVLVPSSGQNPYMTDRHNL